MSCGGWRQPWWVKSRGAQRRCTHTPGFPHRRITRLITQHDSGPVLADKSDLLHRLGQSLSRTDAPHRTHHVRHFLMPAPTPLPLFPIFESIPRIYSPFPIYFDRCVKIWKCVRTKPLKISKIYNCCECCKIRKEARKWRFLFKL